MIAKTPFWRVFPGAREDEFILPVTLPATVGPEGAPHVMGGVALAAAVDALELASGMPLLWASAQFLAPTQHAEELTIRAEQYGGGQAIGQWFADITVNGRLVQRVNAALGAREPSEPQGFAVMPSVPPPTECEPKPDHSSAFDGNLIGQLEFRIAEVDEARGFEAVWSRSKAGFAIDAGWLAIVSDFFLGAHPRTRGGASLDDTVRVIRVAEPGWVLSVTELAAFERGTVSGHARHFAEDGRLIAISSQTGVLPRIPPPIPDFG